MGPFSEELQYKRASSIKRLLEQNPGLDPVYKAIWKNHLLNLAHNETTYNFRVKYIYSKMQSRHRGWISYE